VLETAFCEDGLDGAALAVSPLARRALERASGIARLALFLDRPLIGLGAGAGAYYPGAGELLAVETIIPDHADVANAVGAVVGQVRIAVTAEIVQPAEGRFEIAGLAEAAGLAFPTPRRRWMPPRALCRDAAGAQRGRPARAT
jgi:N-methylhydantoinase A/oxoprolinase/acetone carboxylase beta subunit